MLLALAMPLGGVMLARRNIRLGRGDRKGAFRVALFVFLRYAHARAFPRGPRGEFRPGAVDPHQGLRLPLLLGAQVWLLYMALEPFARRRWPHVLISWKRLLGGSLRDPLVGRDVLLGAPRGLVPPSHLHRGPLCPLCREPARDPGASPGRLGAELAPTRGFRVFVNQYSAVLYGMVFLFMLTLLRMLVRKPWLGDACGACSWGRRFWGRTCPWNGPPGSPGPWSCSSCFGARASWA